MGIVSNQLLLSFDQLGVMSISLVFASTHQQYD